MADSTRISSAVTTFSGCKSDHRWDTIDTFLKHLAKEDNLQATQHREAVSNEDWKLFSYFRSKSYTKPRVLTQAVWFFRTCHFGLRSRGVNWVAWRLPSLLSNFRSVSRATSSCVLPLWSGLDGLFMTKYLGLIVDLCTVRDRENVCVCDVTKLYEKEGKKDKNGLRFATEKSSETIIKTKMFFSSTGETTAANLRLDLFPWPFLQTIESLSITDTL